MVQKILSYISICYDIWTLQDLTKNMTIRALYRNSKNAGGHVIGISVLRMPQMDVFLADILQVHM
jgi:hypothetical protein